MTSYAAITDGNTYFLYHMQSSPWDNATDSQRTKALVHATRLIDSLNYRGSKASSTQELEFPREDDTSVPTTIQEACLEIALALLDGANPELDYDALRIQAERFSQISQSYKDSGVPLHVLAGIPSVAAWKKLLPYLRDPYSIGFMRV